MKKLEDIPKRDPFEAPEGYFDKLPGMVQARVSRPESLWKRLAWRPLLQFAVPSLVIAVLAVIYFAEPSTDKLSTQELLANIDTDTIADYLLESDLTTEDFLESLDLTQLQADSLEFDSPTLDFSENEWNDVLNDYNLDLENLWKG